MTEPTILFLLGAALAVAASKIRKHPRSGKTLLVKGRSKAQGDLQEKWSENRAGIAEEG